MLPALDNFECKNKSSFFTKYFVHSCNMTLIANIYFTFLLSTVLVKNVSSNSLADGSPCYKVNKNGQEDLLKPQVKTYIPFYFVQKMSFLFPLFKKCMPPFENVVANAKVTVSPEFSTCGLSSTSEFCVLKQKGKCYNCSDTTEGKRHPPKFLTDQHTEVNQTWWQSVTMFEGVHENEVNLTVNFGEL